MAPQSKRCKARLLSPASASSTTVPRIGIADKGQRWVNSRIESERASCRPHMGGAVEKGTLLCVSRKLLIARVDFLVHRCRKVGQNRTEYLYDPTHIFQADSQELFALIYIYIYYKNTN